MVKLRSFQAQKAPRVPKGTRIYAVGDIHGCDKALAELHETILSDAAAFEGRKHIVYLGDYVDRGPSSREVIDRLIAHGLPEFSARYIKGNHDVALLEFLRDAKTYRGWRGVGGAETLLSYGVRPPRFDRLDQMTEAQAAFAKALPAAHLKFLRALESMIIIGDYAFVHAGIRPGKKLSQQDEEDLLWIRDEFLRYGGEHEKVIVHGHSPTPEPLALANRISVDTGTYMTGTLSCAVLEGDACRFLQAHAP